jgi:serine/threonine protein kinase
MQRGADTPTHLLRLIRPIPLMASCYYLHAMAQILDSFHHALIILLDAYLKNYVLDAKTGALLAIDFGMAMVEKTGRKHDLNEGAGSFYMAPEQWEWSELAGDQDVANMLSEHKPVNGVEPEQLCNALDRTQVTRAADVWTLGYNAYVLFYGAFPLADVSLDGDDGKTIIRKIARYLYGPVCWGGAGKTGRDAIGCAYCRSNHTTHTGGTNP